MGNPEEHLLFGTWHGQPDADTTSIDFREDLSLDSQEIERILVNEENLFAGFMLSKIGDDVDESERVTLATPYDEESVRLHG